MLYFLKNSLHSSNDLVFKFVTDLLILVVVCRLSKVAVTFTWNAFEKLVPRGYFCRWVYLKLNLLVTLMSSNLLHSFAPVQFSFYKFVILADIFLKGEDNTRISIQKDLAPFARTDEEGHRRLARLCYIGCWVAVCYRVVADWSVWSELNRVTSVIESIFLERVPYIKPFGLTIFTSNSS